jgi:O-antigen/teichoic acid export membrane protein
MAHFWQSSANYVHQGSALVISMVLARLLTPGQFGQFALANAYIQLAFIPLSVGLDQVLVSKAKGHADFPKVMTVTYVQAALRLVVIGSLSVLFYGANQSLMAWVCLLCGLPAALTPVLNGIKSRLEGDGIFRHNFEGVVWGQLSGFVVSVVGALAGLGVFALCMTPWIDILIRVRVYRKFIQGPMLPRPTSIEWRFFASHGIGLWINSATDIAMARVDKWFVGTYSGTEALGHYNRAFNWSPLSQMMLGSLMTNPSVRIISTCPDVRAEIRYIKKIFLIAMSGGVVNGLMWYYGADYLVLWLFGSQWVDSVPIFRSFAPLALLYAFAQIPATPLLARRKYVLLGGSKLITLVILCVLLFLTRGVSPVGVAAVLQGAILLNGIIIWSCYAAILSRTASSMSDRL